MLKIKLEDFFDKTIPQKYTVLKQNLGVVRQMDYIVWLFKDEMFKKKRGREKVRTPTDKILL